MIKMNTVTYIQIKRLDNEYSEKIRRCQKHDIECGHNIADNELLALLKELGFDKVLKEYVKLDKWYS